MVHVYYAVSQESHEAYFYRRVDSFPWFAPVGREIHWQGVAYDCDPLFYAAVAAALQPRGQLLRDLSETVTAWLQGGRKSRMSK